MNENKILIFLLFIHLAAACKRDETTSYYSNGQPKEVIRKVPGGQEECHKIYFSNGKIEKEFCLIKGKLEGLVRFYHESGYLLQEQFFKNGKESGPGKIYYPDGKLKETASFADGLQDGPHEYFREDGKLRSYHYFKTGVAYYKKVYEYNVNGQLVSAEEEIAPIVFIKDSVQVGSWFEIDFQLPYLRPDSKFNNGNFFIKYDLITVQRRNSIQNLPFPSIKIPIENLKAKDQIRLLKPGLYNVYGSLFFMNEREVDSIILGGFEKQIKIVE